MRRHAAAYGDNPIYRNMLDVGGDLRASACAARSTPGRRTTVANLQHAVRGNLPDEYKAFAADDQRPERSGC